MGRDCTPFIITSCPIIAIVQQIQLAFTTALPMTLSKEVVVSAGSFYHSRKLD